MADARFVTVERDGDLALVTINRPEKLNALNGEVLGEIGDAFRGLRDDDEVRGVILTGAGEKAFVAGADISEIACLDAVSGVGLSRAGQGIFQEIERFPKPVLAAVGGYALGGGFELALACHVRIASRNARFGLPEVGLGIIPGYGGTVRLARLVGLGRAVEFTLTGEMVGAEQAQQIGIVSAVVAQEALIPEAKGWMRKITKNGPIAVRLALESIYRAVESSTAGAMAAESTLFGLAASTEDMREGTRAFSEKRPPRFQGR